MAMVDPALEPRPGTMSTEEIATAVSAISDVMTLSRLVLEALTVFAFSFNATFDLGSAGIPENRGVADRAEDPGAGNAAWRRRPGGHPAARQDRQGAEAADLAAFQAKLKGPPGVGAVTPPRISADKATADYTVTLSFRCPHENSVQANRREIRGCAHP